MSSRLSESEIQARLDRMVGWELVGGQLEKHFEFVNFVAALGFVDRVGLLAELAGHHPDIDIRYNKVRFGLSTHSEGGITELDFQLANQIDAEALP